MTVHLMPLTVGSPPGKLAEAELHFEDGPLAGLKLIGFSIWERQSDKKRTVTFPARQYSVNGERRSFALLRPRGIDQQDAHDRIKQLILDAYAARLTTPISWCSCRCERCCDGA